MHQKLLSPLLRKPKWGPRKERGMFQRECFKMGVKGLIRECWLGCGPAQTVWRTTVFKACRIRSQSVPFHGKVLFKEVRLWIVWRTYWQTRVAPRIYTTREVSGGRLISGHSSESQSSSDKSPRKQFKDCSWKAGDQVLSPGWEEKKSELM